MKRIVILSMIILIISTIISLLFGGNIVWGRKQITTIELEQESVSQTQEKFNYNSNEKQAENDEQPEINQREESDATAEEVLAQIMIMDEKYLQNYQTEEKEEFQIIGTIKIDKIDLQYDILSDTSPNLLKISLNRYWGPTKVNTVGNMCIVGHNYKNLTHFGKLNELVKGDTIEIIDPYGVGVTYQVYDKFIADPYDTKCTSQLTNGNTEITLITCYEHGTQRMIIKARAMEKRNKNLSELITDILE